MGVSEIVGVGLECATKVIMVADEDGSEEMFVVDEYSSGAEVDISDEGGKCGVLSERKRGQGKKYSPDCLDVNQGG